MTIEIHSPYLRVEESLLLDMEKEMMLLCNLNKQISRAEISLREEAGITEDNKICEVRLTIFSDTLYSRRGADTFHAAAQAVMEDLRLKVIRQYLHRNDLRDDIVTTVAI